jgi:hypothetical protein
LFDITVIFLLFISVVVVLHMLPCFLVFLVVFLLLYKDFHENICGSMLRKHSSMRELWLVPQVPGPCLAGVTLQQACRSRFPNLPGDVGHEAGP